MNTVNIIGRQRQLETLKRLYNSHKSEFLAIYGRRRVGKSYLIDEAFRNELSFSVVGIYKNDVNENAEIAHRKTQLKHFYRSLLDYGLSPSFKEPGDWMEAFELLKQLLVGRNEERKIVFMDELPWLAGTHSSELIEELGYFWNNWAVKQRNIILIVCGSATSWMLNNVIRDYGGLHSRITEKMYLAPFNLHECREYFHNRGFLMSDYEIALCYMAIGGIPYYMDRMQPDRTLNQNINEFYFADESIDQEFKDVYTGLFQSSEKYIDIVKALGKKFYGMTRNELLEATGQKGGGTFTKMIDNLLACGIIRSYSRYGAQRKEVVYQLYDFFSLFYLNFVKRDRSRSGWTAFQRSGEYDSWAGRTFEILCSWHIRQLQNALRVNVVGGDYSWRGQCPDGKSVQIDMVIPSPYQRTDYICEMKFSENRYYITAEYERKLLDKIDAFKFSKNHKPSHSLMLVLVTSMGLGDSVHDRVVNSSITLDDLFKE